MFISLFLLLIITSNKHPKRETEYIILYRVLLQSHFSNFLLPTMLFTQLRLPFNRSRLREKRRGQCVIVINVTGAGWHFRVWTEIAKWSNLLSEELKWSGGHEEVCLTHIPPSIFLQKLLNFWAMSEPHLFAMAPGQSHPDRLCALLRKDPICFINQHSSFAW